MTEQLREKLKRGGECYGLYISMSDSSVIEMAAQAGYDFVRIDLEHSLISQSELREMIRVANLVKIPVFIRLAELSSISAILDSGADGVVIPHVDSREAAVRAVQETKFAPFGARGLALSQRSALYGETKSQEYIQKTNENILLCVQIEDRVGVENVEEILSVPGVDMVSTGRNDLSQSFGLIGQNTHPDVIAAESRVIEAAMKHKVQPVLLVGSETRRDELHGKGVTCFNIGRDISLMYQAMKRELARYQK